MKALIQRVKNASVTVDGHTIGQIDAGILAYVGIGHGDDLAIAKKMVDKILTYRLFANEQGKLDFNVGQVGGGLLIVSQFTLMARTNKGRRPDFTDAMPPNQANALFTQLIDYAQIQYSNVQTGEFGANMQVMATNDGPLNFLLEISLS